MMATIEIGTLSGWLTLVMVGAIGWTMVRGGSGTAVSGLQDTNKELERQVHARDATIIEKDRLITELRAQKDINVALVPITESLLRHEERAQERHTATLNVLNLIAANLGRERNGD